MKLQIDLAAESAIAAERDSEKIAVEIKLIIYNPRLEEIEEWIP